MGKGARWISRWSTAIVLVGAVSSAAAGTAFGYAEGGVGIPDSTFRQGSGTQEVAIAVTSPAVGTDETLVVWPFYSTDYHWLVGVSADPSTGASCTYDVGQWQCTPGQGGWHAGSLRVRVNTAKPMNCGLHAGICQADEIIIQSIPAPANRYALPAGQPLSVFGDVLIMPASVPWHGPTPAPVFKPLALTSPSPVTTVDAENTSATSPSSNGSATPLYAALGVLVLLGAAFPFGYRRFKRRG